MGIYSRVVFPFILEKAMNHPQLGEHRQKLLAQARGRTLEIGFGTGTNLKFYPREVTEVTALEPNPGMEKYWRPKIPRSPVKVEVVTGSATAMPFVDASFDTVVSTLVLCSVNDVEKALKEIRRVLKPDGRFLFLEHGLHPNRSVAKFQEFLNPLNMRLADGCHINRNMAELIRQAGFDAAVENSVLPKAPPTHAYLYEGCATTHAHE